jgi:dienelactone hydrolase
MALLVAATGAAQQMSPQVVSLHASDGTVLKATYFASGKPGPGVLLLHQCNQQRKLWDVLGERLASSGISVLTFDYRGFGESGGTPHDKLTTGEEIKVQTEIWPGDIEIAFQYLLAQPGVARERIGIGGASCGVYNAIKLARQHAHSLPRGARVNTRTKDLIDMLLFIEQGNLDNRRVASAIATTFEKRATHDVNRPCELFRYIPRQIALADQFRIRKSQP